MPKTSPLPDDLRDRYAAWKSNAFDQNLAHHLNLAQEGQSPRDMVITCCDSRVQLTDMFSTEAGEIFVQRNVAALVPAKDTVTRDPTAAALEFAVNHLGVERLIVMGHSKCGGVKGCYEVCEKGSPNESYIGAWVELLQPAFERLPVGGDMETRLEAMEKESVRLSLRNMLTYPWIADGHRSGRLTLVGLWIDLASGRLEVWSHEDDAFLPV